MQEHDVVGIGNAIVDIIARCDDAFLSKHDLAKGFMRLIPAGEAGRLYEAMGPAIERSGGSAANTIAGLASLGARCGFIGRVAADQFGGIFRHDIRSLGVAYDTPPADDGEPTARMSCQKTLPNWSSATRPMNAPRPPNDASPAMVLAAEPPERSMDGPMSA